MNKETYLVVGALLVGLLLGYLGFHSNQVSYQRPFGASSTINGSSALSDTKLYNNLESLAEDISNLRGQFVNATSASVVINWPPFGSSSTLVTSTLVAGVVPGDIIFVSGPTTSTNRDVAFYGNATGNATSEVQLFAVSVSSTLIDLPASFTMQMRTLRSGNYGVIAPLQVTTGTLAQ